MVDTTTSDIDRRDKEADIRLKRAQTIAIYFGMIFAVASPIVLSYLGPVTIRRNGVEIILNSQSLLSIGLLVITGMTVFCSAVTAITVLICPPYAVFAPDSYIKWFPFTITKLRSKIIYIIACLILSGLTLFFVSGCANTYTDWHGTNRNLWTNQPIAPTCCGRNGTHFKLESNERFFNRVVNETSTSNELTVNGTVLCTAQHPVQWVYIEMNVVDEIGRVIAVSRNKVAQEAVTGQVFEYSVSKKINTLNEPYDYNLIVRDGNYGAYMSAINH